MLVEGQAGAQRERARHAPRDAVVNAEPEDVQARARRQPPELLGRHGAGGRRNSGAFQPAGDLLTVAEDQDGEHDLGAAGALDGLEQTEVVLDPLETFAPTPDADETAEVVLLGRRPGCTQLGDPPEHAGIPVHERADVRRIVDGGPPVRLEGEVAPLDELGAAQLRKVHRIDAHLPLAAVPAGHEVLARSRIEERRGKADRTFERRTQPLDSPLDGAAAARQLEQVAPVLEAPEQPERPREPRHRRDAERGAELGAPGSKAFAVVLLVAVVPG